MILFTERSVLESGESNVSEALFEGHSWDERLSLHPDAQELHDNGPDSIFLRFFSLLLLKAFLGKACSLSYEHQNQPCHTWQDFDCYSQIKEQYKSNLENGFVDKDGSYHSALKLTTQSTQGS